MARRGVLGESIATAALAGLLFGFDTAVVAGVTGDWRRVFGLEDVALGLTVSAAVWGTLVGALVAGIPGDRYGARTALRILAVLYIGSAVIACLSWGLAPLIAARFVTGLAIGGSSVLAPVYIAEIAPAERRGRLVGLFQLMIVAGILVAFLSNAVVGEVVGADAWRWKLGIAALPAFLFLGLLYRIPESPRWLATHGRDADALASLRLIGNPDPEHALRDIHAGLSTHTQDSATRLSWRVHRKPILLAMLLAMFNQLAGINAILYYSNDIFAAAGYGRLSADLQTIAVGATNLIFTIVGLALIDRLGRKTLLLIGAAGMALCLGIVSAIFWGLLPKSLLLVMLIGYIAFFAPSQGAVIWVYLSEIFPTRVRSRGAGLGSSVHWLMNAVIVAVFPAVAAQSTGAPFLFFAAMMAAQFIVVLLFFPETKGVTLEDIEARMERAQ
ncbi:sugar porter family MFS transporter [uncultured Sphingomonas sp.]|uniref:sugar porter family MFS transporter n=1 Tax=uncultured Sphingomonas sp. TaxID=158754 RepID=UPI0025F0E497|nr:sugar porter family MFS transporter [uncultured Sphingomonas sp.]